VTAAAVASAACMARRRDERSVIWKSLLANNMP
jgi:hypothetical protein